VYGGAMRAVKIIVRSIEQLGSIDDSSKTLAKALEKARD